MASLRRDKRVKFDDRTPLGAEEESVSTALSKLSDANSATGIESCGEMILEAIAKAKTRRETRSSQEIHSSMVDLERALAERDRALKQVDTLEDENDYLRGRVEHLQQENALSDQFMVQSLQARLETVELERSIIQDQYDELKTEIGTLRAIYSLHKSLSQEKELKTQFSTSLDDFEGCLRKRENEVFLAQQENRKLAQSLEKATYERNQIALDYADLQRGYQKVLEHNHKLQSYLDQRF
eukprot:m.35682 g.35682  ORF g.35682 m.35682 type:complete len:240 (+) comp32165_c0_seq3:81-800(+)